MEADGKSMPAETGKMEGSSGAEHKNHSAEPRIVGKIRSMSRSRFVIVMAISIFWVCFQLYVKAFGQLDQWVQLPLHLCTALTMVFLLNPLAERYGSRMCWVYDIFLIGADIIVLWYFLANAAMLGQRSFGVDPLTDTDIFIAILLVVIVMEAVRRVVSTSLFIFLLLFMGYAWFGQFFSGNLHHEGLSFGQFCESVMLGEEGIFGSPLYASFNTLFYFLVFGCFFSSCGGGAVLIDAGLRISDKLVGGPAKAAVICSGLMGMVSGSAVANVSGTGVFTIPLMKKAGYSPEEAGSIESVASTGGQLMPPIMGAGAFIMAEILGVRYANIALIAIIPAFAYFASAYILVHLISRKRGIGRHAGVHIEEKPILPRLYRLLPIAVLVALLIAGFRFAESAIICTFLSIIVGAVSKDTRMDIRKLAAVLLNGIRHASNMAVPTAACGIMIGIAVRTDIAAKIANAFANVQLLPVLVFVMLVCLLLGMALPTVAAYLIAYTLFIPMIEGYGISDIAANMFIFYFGVVAQITPPVCPASYTAAGIAGANEWRTGWKAYSYATVTFIVPFMFLQRQALLLAGTAADTAVSVLVLFVVLLWLAAAVAGFMFKNLNAAERAVFVAAALLLVFPVFNSFYAGLAAGALMTVYCFARGRLGSKQQTA